MLSKDDEEKFEKMCRGEASCDCKACIDFLFLTVSNTNFTSVAICVSKLCLPASVCVDARTRACVPAVIFSIVVFALHACGIFRLVASHPSPSHLTHLLPMSECLCACSCVHLWSDTSLCTPTSLTAGLPRSYLQRFPLATPACRCVVSGKIVR